MQRILVIRGGAVGDGVLTLPAIGALRLAFPSTFIDGMGDAKRLSPAYHPVYADAIADAEQWVIYRLFGHESRVLQQLAAYLGGFHLILSCLPAEAVIQTLQAMLNGTFQFNPSDLGYTHLQMPA